MYEKIKEDLKEAMKSQDKFRLSVIRMLKAALMNEEVALHGNGNGLSDDEVLNVIKREVKKRANSVEEYTKYNRLDEVDNLNKEIEILKEYLPQELSEEELDKALDELFTELNVTSIKDMGKVMKELTSKYGARLDNKMASTKIKERLS